jgi:homoserine dehydrogenase
VRERVIVLKLGGSVLLDEASLPKAVHEIYRWRRAGHAVVAVVSALAGETDRLLSRSIVPDGSPYTSAALAANGEALSAALLAAALDRAGVPARVLSPSALRLRADGPPLDATPAALDRGRLARALASEGVAIVPGFAGEDAEGRTVLLGRGGSDLTALFLAHELGARELGARCRLLKDVGALFERDPAAPGPPPRRFACASFADALRLDGSIVQHKALRFARDRGLAFEVGGLNRARATLVGPWASRLEPSTLPRRPLRVALLGLGTVGGGVWSLLRDLPSHFEPVAVAARDAEKARALGVPVHLRMEDPWAALAAEPDVVVELLGGAEPARSLLSAALDRGFDAVTANKRVLAERGAELEALALESGARLCGSAAVGGSAPVLEHVARIRPGEARSVRGVLNGTANFVLGELASGQDLESALADAQARGLTERDAARDLDGRDAADKLCVIASKLGVPGLAVERSAVDAADSGTPGRAANARSRGRALRQVATLDLESRPAARVELAELGPDDPLCAVAGARNALVIERRDGRSERVEGVGAGRWPAAQAVLGDLLSLARDV